MRSSVPRNAPMCCVIPPASCAAIWLFLRLSSREVFPWSTWPMMVTTGARGTNWAGSGGGLTTIQTEMDKWYDENYTIKIIIKIVLTVSGYLCFLWLWFLPVWPICVSFPISLLLLLSISPPALCRAPTRPDRHLCSAGPHRRDLKTEQHRYTLLLLPLGPGRYFILQKLFYSACVDETDQKWQ